MHSKGAVQTMCGVQKSKERKRNLRKTKEKYGNLFQMHMEHNIRTPFWMSKIMEF